MLTKTIGQLTSASSLTSADYLEVEIAGASKKVDVGMVGDALTATSAQSIAGSSNDVFITPATLRAGINAETSAPIYACRAWAVFNPLSSTENVIGSYTRVVGTTQTVCVATGHGFITGNVAYIDFTTGGASDNSYIVTAVDSDTFSVNTISTSSILTSAFTLKRCELLNSGNINSVSYIAVGTYAVNFASTVPSNYAIASFSYGSTYAYTFGNYSVPLIYQPTQYALGLSSIAFAGGAVDPSGANCEIFA